MSDNSGYLDLVSEMFRRSPGGLFSYPGSGSPLFTSMIVTTNHANPTVVHLRCEFCGSGWHEHNGNGRCVNCGAPE